MVSVCQWKSLHTTQTADGAQGLFTRVSIHGIQEIGLGNGMSLSDISFPTISYMPAIPEQADHTLIGLAGPTACSAR